MSAWGKTGRVTLVNESPITTPGGTAGVSIDGDDVGWIGYPADDDWWAYVNGLNYNLHLPSRDAAVLWVLRRVDPALWRQERGAVFRVEHASNARGWDVIEPGRAGFIPFSGWDSAISVAQTLARQAVAR